MSKLRYFIQRTIVTILLVFAVASAVFLVFRLMPGDYTTMLATSGASPSDLEALREKWGLNDPLHIQYITFLENLVTGDLGTSHQTNAPVLTTVGSALANSFILAFPGLVVAYLIGSTYGAYIGHTKNERVERYGIIPPSITGTAPDFFLGILMIFVFATHLGLFPTQGIMSVEAYGDLGSSPSRLDVFTHPNFWYHYTLPFITIVLKFAYMPALVMRGSIVETSGQAFAYYHRIKGLSVRTRYKHLMRHASLPVITLFPASSARSLSGLVLIEVVFNWPGIGLLLVNAVSQRDTPVVQFMFIVIALWIILGNWIVDIFYTIIDPRISIGGDTAEG